MQTYRIKHLPTGLYYKPVMSTYPKTNLSKKGKMYMHRKPQLPSCISVNPKQNDKFNLGADVRRRESDGCMLSTSDSDWELEEYNLL